MPTQNQLEKFIHRLHPVTRAMLRAPLEMRDAAAVHALHPRNECEADDGRKQNSGGNGRQWYHRSTIVTHFMTREHMLR